MLSQTSVATLEVPVWGLLSVTVVELVMSVAVYWGRNLLWLGNESGGQSGVFTRKKSGVFAGSVGSSEKMTVVELSVREAVPGTSTPVR